MDVKHLKSGLSLLEWKIIDKQSQVLPVIKNLPAPAEDIKDVGLIPGLGRSPEVGNGSPLQHSCLENCRDRGAWPRSHKESYTTERTHI